MAQKGDKARLCDAAMRLYVDGQSLTAISETLGVSRQALGQWKADTRAGGEDLDAWDRAREEKRGTARRLSALLAREMEYAEGLPPGRVPPGTWDSISKLGALVQRFEAAEREEAARTLAKRSGLFLEFVRDMITFFSMREPQIVQGLEQHFDDLIQWGREKHGDRRGQ
jgi:hypothetical protein